MNLSDLPDATFAWDQYWRDGRLASCGGEGGANYQPVITKGWERFFGTLSDGARLLDICTGNGAVARLAAAAAKSRNLKVTIEAVDSATINPMRSGPGIEMIRFSSRTPAEKLPFADASFDAIVGQYAIEYTDVERTLTELNRVSRRTADIRFVTHSAGSHVVQEAERQLADVERLTETGIFDAAEQLARASDNHPAGAQPDDARRNFENAVQRLREATKSADDLRMYNNVGNVIVHAIGQQPRVGTGPVLDKIAETAAAIGSHAARLSAMRRAALDAARAHALAALAERLWNRQFRLEALVRSDQAVFGWVIESDPVGQGHQ